MDIEITSEDKGDHLLILSVGSADGPGDLLAHAQLVYGEIVKYDQKKILIDDIQTRFPHNLLPYYQQVESFSESFPPEIRLLKIAVVLSPGFEEVGKFWETVAVNRGFKYFAFTSIEKAYDWLLK